MMDYTIDENFTLTNDYLYALTNNSFNYSNQTSINEDDLNNNYLVFRDQSRFWIQRVLVPIITVIGVIGNSMTIIIMTHRRMRSSTNSYLAALATFDMLYLIFTFVLSLSHYPNAESTKYYYYWLLWPITVLICDASSNTSVWITVTFTIERYIVVCHPMLGKVICTPSRTKKLILIVSTLCFFSTLPTVFEWKITEKLNPNNNQTYVQVVYSEFGLNVVYKRVYYWLTVILFVITPLIVLAVFNIFLIRSVRVSATKRRTLATQPSRYNSSRASLKSKWSKSESPRQESHITIMLIAVVILFLVCQLPTACVLIYSAFHDEEDDANKQLLIRGLGNIFNFLVAINAAGNFVLYCLLSQKYRRTFKKTFCFFSFKNRKVFRFSRSNQKTVQTDVPIMD